MTIKRGKRFVCFRKACIASKQCSHCACDGSCGKPHEPLKCLGNRYRTRSMCNSCKVATTKKNKKHGFYDLLSKTLLQQDSIDEVEKSVMISMFSNDDDAWIHIGTIDFDNA